MGEGMQDKSAMGNLMADILKSSGLLLESAMKQGPVASAASSEDGNGKKNRYLDSIENTINRWQSISSTLNDPNMADAILKGLNTLPEFYMTLAKTGWEASVRLQKQVMEKASKIGKKTEAYNFDNLEQDLFKAWKEIYEEEFRQYFNIPQLGLMRFHQERFNRFLDQTNLLQATLSEFIFILYLPIEKSFKVFQDQIEQMYQEGRLPDKAKEYYNIWLKILEGHYMTLFKSSEYLSALQATLRQLEAYTDAKNTFLEDILQSLPIPTNKDMDNMYKELYLLKKQVKTLEKKVKDLEARNA
ncbi:MAG: hypothetical protein CSYNP_00484 [Syntrophus sp. SKADARSKE-3]|nr:hypothetical protein [Syntrophus sp. SKADARSKE-3]